MMSIIIKSMTGCLFAFYITEEYEAMSPITGELIDLHSAPLSTVHKMLKLHIVEYTSLHLSDLL